MRHLKTGNRLGMTTSHRRAVMRNMVTSIIENGQITCTLARAKEVRKPLEKMISWGKKGNLHARRRALRFIKSKEAISILFGELAERYKDRNGGFSRIIKLGKKRLGDNSEMAILQLLESEKDKLTSLKSKSSKKKIEKNIDRSVLKEVSEEISEEGKVGQKEKTTNIEPDDKKETPENVQKIENTPVENKKDKNEQILDSTDKKETPVNVQKIENTPVENKKDKNISDNSDIKK